MSETIELIKSEIYEAKSNLEKFKHLGKEHTENFTYKFYSTYFTNRLNILEQIKAKLEAWEVVEKHLDYFPDDYWNGITEEIITMTSKIDKKDYPIIKKALEIKK